MSDAVLADLLSLKPDAKYLRIDHPVYSQFGDKKERDTALAELKLPTDKKYVLFFGFIRDYKGLDLLIKALEDLPEDHHLIVAGEVYGSFEKYEKLIDETKTRSRVHLFNKYISDNEVGTYFSAVDACILPYKGATQSGITAIAHHFDLPIIATDVGGLKENTKHNETGLIVERPDSSLIADSIAHYYKQDLKEKFSKNIAMAKTENSWENFSERVIEFSETI
ncbi:MAG: glycosyltransferase [Crocinitomicaceae bacterium]|nr:glycosyltransferase [Crocinitomicaceae bacterium]